MADLGVSIQAIEGTLRDFWQSHNRELRERAPVVYATDPFRGPVLNSQPGVWVIGNWYISRSGDDIVARVNAQIGQAHGEVAEEVVRVTLKPANGTVRVMDWHWYIQEGTVK